MNYFEYSKKALRTAPSTVKLYALNGGSHCCLCTDLSMAALGLAGEVSELGMNLFDEDTFELLPITDSFVLELGDILWYLNVAAILMDLDFKDLFKEDGKLVSKVEHTFSIQLAYVNLSIMSGLFADLVKKSCAQFHPIAYGDGLAILASLAFDIQVIASLLHVSLFDACAMNIMKLEQRYPTGFSTHLSMNRESI